MINRRRTRDPAFGVDIRAGKTYLQSMNTSPDMQDLDKRLAVLEERMNTLKAENTSAQERLNATLEGFRTDQAQLREDMAKRETDAVKREKQQLLAIAGLIAIATTILGILIGLPVFS